MGLRHFVAIIAKLPTFIFWEYLINWLFPKKPKIFSTGYISYCVSRIAYRVGNKIDYYYVVGAPGTQVIKSLK